MNGDTQVTSEVRTLTTPGHTRAHQAVIVESAGESAIFLADAVPWAVTFEKLAWVAAFDVEPLISMETKRSLRDWAWRKEALLFFQHDPTMGAGRLVREGNELSSGKGYDSERPRQFMTTPAHRPTLSVVAPVFNEEAILHELYQPAERGARRCRAGSGSWC